MGYKMPIVCKDLYIPISFNDSALTLREYKEKYGIDLSQYLEVDTNSDEIHLLLPKFTKVYIVYVDDDHIPEVSSVSSIKQIGYQTYVSGSQDAYLNCNCGVFNTNNELEYFFGIEFSIDKNDEFKVENIKITGLA